MVILLATQQGRRSCPQACPLLLARGHGSRSAAAAATSPSSDRSQQSQVGSTAGSAYTPQEAILRATNAQVNQMLVERVNAIERMSWGRPVVQKDGVKVCQNIVFPDPDLLHSSPHWGVGGFKNK